MTEPVGRAAAAGPRASLDRVMAAVHALGLAVRTERPTSLMVGCPVHDDKTPSLHVSWQAGPRGGYTLLHCFGCQARAEDLVGPLRLAMADLFDEPLPERDRDLWRVGRSTQTRRAARRRGRLGHLPTLIAARHPVEPEHEHVWVEVERYPYVDPDGDLVQEVVRQECTVDGGRHKQFRQRFFTTAGRSVAKQPPGFRPVLYRAPRVREAVQAGETVWLVEGEKDVHTAERLGVVATTNSRGGKGFPDELVEELRGATVVVVLDRDATGWARGVALHRKLTAAGATVSLKLPAITEAKADFTDHVQGGGTTADLIDVSVHEVAARDALTAAQLKHRQLEQAIVEADTHLELAAAGTDADAHRQHAQRWAVETQIQQESLRDLVERVHGHGLRVGTEWAGEAMQSAADLLAAGTEAARRCHRAAGVAVPPSLMPAGEGIGADGAADPVGGIDAASGGAAAAPTTTGKRAAAGTAAAAPVFRELDGQIVQWESGRSSRRGSADGEPDDEGRLKVILSMVVKVSVREYLEVEDHLDVEEVPLLGRASAGRPRVSTNRTLAAMRLCYADPTTGEQMEIRVAADQWRDHSWLDSLPGPVDYDHRRAGLDTVQRAILAVSGDVVDEVLYRATGWRVGADGRHRFIHNRGAITPDGHEDHEVALSGPLRRYDLPDPSGDPQRLRQAFLQHSAAMLDRLPARVAAPLLGQVFRCVLGHNPWVLTLVGPPGSYKTSVAAKAMHHLGEKWEHTRPAASMSGNGDTINALRFKLHNAKDCLYWLDDFAPTKSWLDAQRHLEETARLIHNQEERSRSARDGQSVSDGTGPRASGLCTSEVMPRPGSAAERMLVVPLARDEVATEQLFPLDEPDSRHARALVMASFIQWLAGDLTARREEYLHLAGDYAGRLTEQGETIRQAAAISQGWAGWVAMVDFLLEVGAIDDAERCALLTRVDEALREAGRAAVDADMPRTTGARVRELLGYALRQGIAYVDDVRGGDCPPWPIAGRLGWRRQVIEFDEEGRAVRTRQERMGQRLGYVMHDPGPRDRGRVLMCDSTQLEAVLKAASATQAEQLQIDRNTAMRALHEEGVLIADGSERVIRFTTKCRIHCEDRTARMVALHLDRIIGEDVDDGPDTDGPDTDGHGGDSGGGGGGAAPGPHRGRPLGDAGAGAARPLPGLLRDGPHPVDGSQQAGVPSAADQEDDQVRATNYEPRPWTDRDGVVGWTEPGGAAERGPCVVCGVRCAVVIAGVRVHPRCWEASTAAQRGRPADPTAESAAGSAPAKAPAAAAAARPPRAAGAGFRAAAAVVDVDGIWCSNGERFPLPGELRHVGDLAWLAQRLNLGVQVTKYLPASGQIWLGARLAAELGIDVDAIAAAAADDRDKAAREASKNSPAVTAALAAGYSLGGAGDGLGRWTRVWKGAEKSVWLVLLPAMSSDADQVPLMGGHPDHAALAHRIGLLADALGQPYQLSPQTTGLDLLAALRWKDRDRFLTAREPIPPARLSVEADLSWTRKPTREELEHEFIHAYDRSGSYLAGVAGLELGVGEPTHHPDGAEFVAKVPGYYLIDVPEAGDWRMPHPLDPRGANAGRVRWVTTPALEFAVEQGYRPAIREAYTWSERARVFDPWYERIRDARERLDVDDVDAQIARDQLKAIYTRTLGMLASQRHMDGRAGYAPERWYMIVAKARTNILRRVAKIGQAADRWPVAILADTVLYTSPDPDPVTAWPGQPQWLGRALGRYKVEATGRLGDQLRYLTGGNYRGKDALTERQPDGPGGAQ